MDHGVNAEALAPIKAGVGPLVVGVVLILRVPADAVGIGLVVGPGVAAESGEVLVEAATIRDIEAAALPEALGLHLSYAAIVGIGALGVIGLGRGCVDVDGAEAVDAARGVGADNAGGFFAELTLNGEPVLNLVRDLGVGLEFNNVGRLGRECEAIADGNAAGGGQVGRVEREDDGAPEGVLVAGKIEQRAGTEAIVVDAAASADDCLAGLIEDPGEGHARRKAEAAIGEEVLPVVAEAGRDGEAR